MTGGCAPMCWIKGRDPPGESGGVDARMTSGGDILLLLAGDDGIPGVCCGEKALPISFDLDTDTEGVATGLICAGGGLMTSILS